MGITSMIICGVLLSPAVQSPQTSSEGFPDVPKTHWAYEAVTALKAQGILVGYPPESPTEQARRKIAPPSRTHSKQERRAAQPMRAKPRR